MLDVTNIDGLHSTWKSKGKSLWPQVSRRASPQSHSSTRLITHRELAAEGKIENSWATEKAGGECRKETSFKDLLDPICFLMSLGNFSVKGQILNLEGFMSHAVSLPQLLNSAFVARNHKQHVLKVGMVMSP